MSAPKSEATRAKMSESKKGENNPMFGKNQSSCQKIEVTDLQTGISTSYNSMSEAARALNFPLSGISMYFIRNQKKPYKGRYVLSTTKISKLVRLWRVHIRIKLLKIIKGKWEFIVERIYYQAKAMLVVQPRIQEEDYSVIIVIIISII